MAVFNLAIGTGRKTSGLLPPAKLKKLEARDKKSGGFMEGLEEKISGKAGSEIAKMPVVKLGEMAGKLKDKDIKQLVKTEDLAVYKKIKEAEAGLKTEKNKAAAAIAAVNIEPKIIKSREAVAGLKEIKISSAADIPEAKKRLEELAVIKSSLDEALKEVDAAKAAAGNFASYSSGILKEVEKAKDEDIAGVMKNMDINLLDAGSLERALIGPVWYDRVQKTLEIAALAKKFLPPVKKKAKILERKRGAGRDVFFIGGLPDLWIKEIDLGTRGVVDALVLKGFVRNFTTEQAAVGKPLTFAVEGAKAGTVFGAEGKIDHINDVSDYYAIYGKNMPPEMTGLEGMDYGNVKMKSADMDTEAKAVITGDSLSMKGTAALKKMSFEAADKQDVAYQVLSGMDALKINFEAVNTSAGPGISVSSDAFDRIKKSLERIYGSKINEAKAKVKKEIDSRVKDEISKLTSRISGENSDLSRMIKPQEDSLKASASEIDKISAGINKKISDAAAGAAGNALKGLFGR
jgi:uncharacterized protein (TIGR03545 family)